MVKGEEGAKAREWLRRWKCEFKVGGEAGKDTLGPNQQGVASILRAVGAAKGLSSAASLNSDSLRPLRFSSATYPGLNSQ